MKVIDNTLELTDIVKLAMQEEKISKIKAIELYDKAILDTLEAGKFSSLQLIHHAVFISSAAAFLLPCKK